MAKTPKPTNVYKFPLGSVLDSAKGDLEVMAMAIREGLEDLIIVGINGDGQLAVVAPNTMEAERVHYLLSKATALSADIGVEDDEED